MLHAIRVKTDFKTDEAPSVASARRKLLIYKNSAPLSLLFILLCRCLIERVYEE
jgi:hypothetical protein